MRPWLVRSDRCPRPGPKSKTNDQRPPMGEEAPVLGGSLLRRRIQVVYPSPVAGADTPFFTGQDSIGMSRSLGPSGRPSGRAQKVGFLKSPWVLGTQLNRYRYKRF